MIAVKKDVLYVLSAWPPRSPFTKDMLGSLYLCYSRAKKGEPCRKDTVMIAMRHLQSDVAMAVMLIGERRSFVISCSSHLPPLVILQLLTNWWPKIGNSKLATLRSPKLSLCGSRVCFSEACWNLFFFMTMRLCEPW